RWLERTGEGRDEDAPLLAHHYAEAVRPADIDLAWPGADGELTELRAKALMWLRRAADLAIGRFEIDDGLALLHRALALEPDKAEQAGLWRAVGRANALKLDGEAFWTAMQKSLAGSDDPAIAADTYSELAFQTATRSAMWKRRPDNEMVEDWIEQAIKLSEPDRAARAKALIARACLDPERFAESARDARPAARRSGADRLRAGRRPVGDDPSAHIPCRVGGGRQCCDAVRVERLDFARLRPRPCLAGGRAGSAAAGAECGGSGHGRLRALVRSRSHRDCRGERRPRRSRAKA